MKELPQIVRRSPRQGKNTLKSCREPLIKRLPTTFISYFEKLIGRKTHIVEAKSAVSRNARGGHSSTAPLLLLSKRHPLRWAAVWGRLRRLTPA